MALTRLTHNLSVNKDHVASVHWDDTYSKRLVITMMDGTQHSIKHDGGMYGTDCYAIERKLVDA
ncbi:hypothetical protein AAIH70_28350 [Neorhizobium sp. BT27B]|uniref:hypothetical protein n=1 Tax=Neorhizobium sp. BT27B TaxID=3142625 RepID=UPI003D2DD7B0